MMQYKYLVDVDFMYPRSILKSHTQTDLKEYQSIYIIGHQREILKLASSDRKLSLNKDSGFSIHELLSLHLCDLFFNFYFLFITAAD